MSNLRLHRLSNHHPTHFHRPRSPHHLHPLPGRVSYAQRIAGQEQGQEEERVRSQKGLAQAQIREAAGGTLVAEEVGREAGEVEQEAEGVEQVAAQVAAQGAQRQRRRASREVELVLELAAEEAELVAEEAALVAALVAEEAAQAERY